MSAHSQHGPHRMAGPEKSTDPLELRLAASWPPEAWRDLTAVVAVSGGPDSVALLLALAALRAAGPAEGRLVVGHCNHGLRPGEDQADEDFVRGLCDRLGLDLEVGQLRVPEAAQDQGDGIEAAARTARYEFLQDLAERTGARHVATGHTADDQAETMLHNIVRGTGLAGLAGIARSRALGPAVTLIRPLLEFRRSELLAYLARREEDYRLDATNRDISFTRNRIRHDLLPRIERDYNPGVVEALVRLGKLAREARDVIATVVEDLYDVAVQKRGQAAVEIRCDLLADRPPHVVRELLILVWKKQGWPLQSMGHDQWERLSEMLRSPQASPERQSLPGGVIAERIRAKGQDERLLLARGG